MKEGKVMASYLTRDQKCRNIALQHNLTVESAQKRQHIFIIATVVLFVIGALTASLGIGGFLLIGGCFTWYYAVQYGRTKKFIEKNPDYKSQPLQNVFVHNAAQYNHSPNSRATNYYNISTFISNVNSEIKHFLWFNDGPYKNYIPEKKHAETFRINGYTLSFSTYGTEEPSLIYTQLPISIPRDESLIPRPSYYPSYKELTPEQRWMYWKFLQNPYTGTHDIGYVFIFYYGLERYLFSGQSTNVADIILKLRDCYDNKSFQTYSSTALILYSIVRKDIDLANRFLASLDKKYEMKISPNLLILLKYSLALPLTPFEIMNNAKAFSFNNQHYIKDYPEIFLGFLQQSIKNTYGANNVPLINLFADANVSNIRAIEVPLFANISIIDKVVRIPCLIDYVPFYSEMYRLLNEAHENTKKYLAELRKKPTSKKPSQLPSK